MKKWGIFHGKITLGYIMKRQSFVLCWNMAIFRNYLWLQYKSMTTYKITKAGEGIIPEGDMVIKKNAFKMSKKLKSVIIPEGVTGIEEGAFKDCINLISVSIPNSVTYIDFEAFSGCSGLLDITIPESVEYIGHWAFMDCAGLKRIVVAEGNKRYDSRNDCNAIIETKIDRLLYGCAATIIPDTVKEIGPFSFIRCKALTSISIPSSVTAIGSSAFALCSNLTDVNISENVEIGDEAFFGCPCMNDEALPSVEEKKETVSFTYAGELFFSIEGECELALTDDELKLFKQVNKNCQDEGEEDVMAYFRANMPRPLYDEIYYAIAYSIRYNDAKEMIENEGCYCFANMSEEVFDTMTMDELIERYIDDNIDADLEFIIDDIEINE